MASNYGKAALAKETARLSSQKEPGRNHALNVASMKLHQLVETGDLTETEVLDSLMGACVANGLYDDDGDKACLATALSGANAARKKPRTTRAPWEAPPGQETPTVEGRSWWTSAQIEAIPPPTALVGGVLYRDSLAWLAGDPGTWKTFTAIDLALSIAHGIPWHGHTTTAAKVAYITGEGKSGLGARIKAWRASNGVQANGRDQWLPEAIQVCDPHDRAWLLANIEGVALIVLDTQSRVTAGLEENSSEHMSMFVKALGEIRDASQACVLTLHHPSKGGSTIRGHGLVQGAADTVIASRRLASDSMARLSCSKQKDAREFGEFWIRPIEHQESLVMAQCQTPPRPERGWTWKTHDTE